MFGVILWIVIILGIWIWRKKVNEERKREDEERKREDEERKERLSKVSSNFEDVKIVQTLNNARCKAITSSFHKFFLWEPIDIKKHEYPEKYVKTFACGREHLYIGRRLNPEFMKLDTDRYEKEVWISIGFKKTNKNIYTEELAQIQTDIEELLEKVSSVYGSKGEDSEEARKIEHELDILYGRTLVIREELGLQ